MGSVSTLAVGFGALQAGSTIGGAFAQSSAIKQQAEFQKQSLEFNMKLADIKGAEAERIGQEEAEFVKMRGDQIIGTQRATMAAQGIELDSGTALALQEETARMAEQDAIRIKNNAAREAWGYKVEALNMQGQATFSDLSARYRSQSTLLTGGLQAVGEFGKPFIRARYKGEG